MGDRGPKRVMRISGMDALVLMYHLHEFAYWYDHLDSDRTLSEITGRLNFKLSVYKSVLESGLYACNLLNEEDEFWHPGGLTFREFLRKVAPGYKFNETYSILEDKDK